MIKSYIIRQMFKVKIQRTGNSLCVIIPSPEVDYNEYIEGEWLEVKIIRVKKKRDLKNV